MSQNITMLRTMFIFTIVSVCLPMIALEGMIREVSISWFSWDSGLHSHNLLAITIGMWITIELAASIMGKIREWKYQITYVDREFYRSSPEELETKIETLVEELEVLGVEDRIELFRLYENCTVSQFLNEVYIENAPTFDPEYWDSHFENFLDKDYEEKNEESKSNTK